MIGYVEVFERFEAAHYLTSYKGSPEPIHGHSFGVRVRVCGDPGNEGMIVDFLELKALLKNTIDPFSQRLMNEVPPFERTSPTAEHIARFVYETLKPTFRSAPIRVEVEEAPGCVAGYGDA
jgi:6-pyruvoyltetrahydropterin/6-carboxytetrahydropterin synthase